MSLVPLFIPSPSRGVWHLGPLPIRAYALCIIAGVIAAVVFGERRWERRGGARGDIGDVAILAVPFGLVGARVYSLFTDSDRYFGAGHPWWQPFAIWQGGVGIWGAVAAGILGGAIAARRKHIRLRTMMDAIAPCLLLAQSIGRWGNYFNQELFGRPTTLPWGLEISPAHRPPGYARYATFQPTYLYESIWDFGAMWFVLWADRRFKLGFGRTFAVYVMSYTVGRFWIEWLRIDTIEHHILGLRLNDWTAIVMFLGAAVYFVVTGRRHRGEPAEAGRIAYTDARPLEPVLVGGSGEPPEGAEGVEGAGGPGGTGGPEGAGGSGSPGGTGGSNPGSPSGSGTGAESVPSK